MGLVLLERIIFPAPLIKVSKTHYLKQGGEKTGFFNNPKQIGLSEILHFSKVGFSVFLKCLVATYITAFRDFVLVFLY